MNSIKSIITNSIYCAIGYSLFVFLLYLLPNFIRNNGALWDDLMDRLSFGYVEEEAVFIARFIIGTQGLHAIALIFINACYGVLYWSNIPIIEKYKSEQDPWPFHSKDPSVRREFFGLLYHSIGIIMFNNVCVSIPLSYFASRNSRFSVSLDDFPSNFTLLWHVIFCALIEDALFYWSHRIFHLKSVYPLIHKMHHKWHMPIALSAEYAHPVEFYFGNTLPFALGPGLLKCHMFTL